MHKDNCGNQTYMRLILTSLGLEKFLFALFWPLIGCIDAIDQMEDDVNKSPSGAFSEIDGGAPDGGSGENYVWIEKAKLVAPDGENFDLFGTAVSFYGDTVVIGAQCDDDNGEDSGSAYVFVREEGTLPDVN